MNELWKTPRSWEWTELKKLGDVVSGGTPSTKVEEYWGGEINWISPADLTKYKHKTIAKGAKSISEAGLQHSSAKLMPPGSVHFSSRAPIGYVVISSHPMCTNQGFKSLVPYKGVFNEFVFYYLKSAKQLAEERATGTTFKEISGTAFSKLPIPVPPTNEQVRIVAKIEELFSELDNGIESLNTARKQLEVYRQAILKHAFAGHLSGKWRSTNANGSRVPTDILEDIRQSRSKINAELKHNSTFQSTKKNKFKDSPRVEALSDEALPELPTEWVYVNINDLVRHDRPISYGVIKLGKDEFGGVPTLRSSNVRKLFLDLEYVKPISPAISDHYRRTLLKGGEVIVTIRGTLGGVSVVPDSCEGYNISREVAVIDTVDSIMSEYLQYYIASPIIENWFKQRLRGVAYTGINLATLREMPIALCSRGEQQEIVNVLDEGFSEVNRISQEIDYALKKNEAMRQSILKEAFSGRLIKQDPQDEPASDLVRRIASTKHDVKRTRTKNK
ncbi:MAG: restriction endonuclease subunit S [Candidatus Marinimicrobia bacterium]|nr:restriction endonuclease subunit S [Candidatus Neomarinimicrobiota bacterium]